ncbi:hypothetical protein HWV62_1789 [Athelia sp. TMB]|nr:hypothetical protein HWV62_1789 [Athelia sp. TMB]
MRATGTVAGALDESFSNESQLEIWAPDFMDKNEYDLGGEGHAGPKGVVSDNARFNRLAWGHVDSARPHGVIAAGMESGELTLWDPSSILAGASPTESLILRNSTHTGPIRGLDFSPIQTNLLSSGGINGEVYIWDLKDPSKPYSPTPGTRSTKLDEITSVAWNQQVQHVLAGASSTGYTVVWDLRGKREVVALAYGGGAGTLAGQSGIGGGMAVGGRRGMSAIAWHPDNATRLVTASEDDSSPIIMVWDLRNARAPEKILTGHEKGVLSLSWCKQDADLLLSCGKDNRALCWNPQTSEIIGELPSADNWAFQVDWCPRNPDLLATAFFDGTIGIHSIQSTNEAASQAPASAPTDGADIFDGPGYSRASQSTLSLKQPPKWLRRPTSNAFGFGGKLVTVSNLPSAQGKHQSGVVHIRNVVTETDLVERAGKLQAAIDASELSLFAEQEAGAKTGDGSEAWKALLSLFKADSRDELVSLLGYSSAEVSARVAEAIAKLKESNTVSIKSAEEEHGAEAKPPVVSFAEPAASEGSEGEAEDDEGAEKTPSEVSADISETPSGTRLGDAESATTAPSLFGDNDPVGTPQIDAAADFFSTMGIGSQNDGGEQILVPHHSYGLDSSVAATIGSGPSSVASENLKSNTFSIYPSDESETDRLVTKALVLGDFESAVSLCLSSDRFADAILLAVKGGPELLARTQKAYFARRTISSPYLRLFQSIVTNDLSDIVQNADLKEWQEIFVVLCTFASSEEFSGLTEQLGQRLEFQSSLAKASDAPDASFRAREFRKNATLTYLAAGRLEKLLNIWIEELVEEEQALTSGEVDSNGSRYTAHGHALQTFIEKVTVFRSAINYVDTDLAQTTTNEEAGVKTYKLSGLYDRYFEYADLLATQGLVKEAVSFLKLTPGNYQGSAGGSFDFGVGRERLLAAAGLTVARVAGSISAATKTALPPLPSNSTYGQYQGQNRAPTAPTAPAPSPYGAYNPPTSSQPANPYGASTQQSVGGSYAPPPPSQYQPPVPSYNQPNPYNNPQSRMQPPHLAPPQQAPAVLPPPPRGPQAGSTVPPPPPLSSQSKSKDNGGWNDAPAMVPERRTPSNITTNKPAAIVSPFPNSTQSAPGTPGPGSPYMGGQQSTALPPPPRPGSVQARPPPPPSHRGPPPPQQGGPGVFPPGRPPSGPPGPPPGVAPPSRLMSPPQQGPPRQTTPGQYGPPPGQVPPQGPYGAQQVPAGGPPPRGPPGPPGPPGPYARATPPPQHQQPYGGPPPPAPGLYGPPPGGAPMSGPPMSGPPGQQAPPRGPPGGPPGGPAAPPAPVRRGPPPPKYRQFKPRLV